MKAIQTKEYIGIDIINSKWHVHLWT